MSTTISRLYNWVTDKTNSVKITASKMDAENDQIITALNRKVVCSGSAPGSPIAGQTWVDTTNKLIKIYRNNEWVIIGIVHVSGTAPSTMQTGDIWIDTSAAENVFKVRNKDNDEWDTVPTSPGAGVAWSYKNLSVVYTSATQVTVTADELVLEDTSNVKTIIRSVSEVIAITTSGASGLDTGSEAADTIYYVWIMRKSSDGTVNGLLSVKSTIADPPTWPSGYDQFALVGCVGNNHSSNFIPFKQTGKRYCFTTWATMYSGTPGASWVAVDLTPSNMDTNAGFVPSALSNFCFGAFGPTATGTADLSNVNSTALSQNPNVLIYGAGAAQEVGFNLDIQTADTLYVGGSAMILYLQGFEINKL